MSIYCKRVGKKYRPKGYFFSPILKEFKYFIPSASRLDLLELCYTKVIAYQLMLLEYRKSYHIVLPCILNVKCREIGGQ